MGPDSFGGEDYPSDPDEMRRLIEEQQRQKVAAARKKKKLTLSATQFDNALDCRRKWWFQKVARLPEIRRAPPDPRTIGEVLHEVVARWLSADALGRGPNGLPVDLYPHGWGTVTSQFGSDKGEKRSITAGEGAMIQKLVAAAIEAGAIVRVPGGVVEARFDIPLAQTPRGNIWVMGFRDYTPSRDVVEDHKTMKRNKAPWKKTSNALYKNTQMRTYAYSLIHEAKKRGEPPPAAITVRHNQFSKDPDNLVVDRTPATLPRDVVETWWTSKILPLAHELIALRDVEAWHDVPGAPEEGGGGACNKYGGCPYMRICCGRVSMERFRKTVERQRTRLPQVSCQTPVLNSAPQVRNRSFPMSSFAQKIAAKKARQAAAKAPAAAAPTKPKAEDPKTPAAKPASAPPWAQPECIPCGGTGFNSKGKGGPCRICSVMAGKRGCPKPGDYEITAVDGTVIWVNLSNPDDFGSADLTGPVEVKEEKVAPPPPVEKPKPEAPVAPVEEKVETPEPAPTKRGKGRPKKGFTLLIDCYVVKGVGRTGGGSGMILLCDVIREYGTSLAAEMGKDDYYGVKAWDRRDGLCGVASAMVEDFKTDCVVASTGNPEENALLAALKPLATKIIVGTR